MQAKITLMGLHEYLYDSVDNPDGLFSQLSVPADTMDKDILKNTGIHVSPSM